MYEILVALTNRQLILYKPSKKCPIITFTRHRVLGSELRFSREVYDERRAVFAERLDSMLGYALSADKCRSTILLEYFGEKEAAPCGGCDVCVAKRAAAKPSSIEVSQAAVLQLLADNKQHSLDELNVLLLPKETMRATLRALCDEEKIKIDNGKIMINR